MRQPVYYDPDTGEEIVVAQFATAYVPFNLPAFGGYEVVVTYLLSTALETAGEGGVAVPAVPSAGASSTGVVVGGSGNRCEVYVLSTNRKIADGSGNEVYARVVHDGADFRLQFFSLVGSTETQYTFAAGSAIAVEVPYRFHRYVLPHDWFTRYSARRPYQDVQGGSGSLSLLDLSDASFPPGGYAGLAGAILRVNASADGFEAVPEGDPPLVLNDIDIGSVDGSVVVVKGGTANHPEFDVSVPGGNVHRDPGPKWHPRLYDIEEGYELQVLANYSRFRKEGSVVYIVFVVNFRVPASASPMIYFGGLPYYTGVASRLGSFLLMSPGNASTMTVTHLMAGIGSGFDTGWFQASSGNGDYYHIPPSAGDTDWWIQGEFFYFASNDDRVNFLYDGSDGAGNDLDGGVFGDSYTRTVDCGQSFV